MVDVIPLGNGKATYGKDKETIVATFPIHSDMIKIGYKMVSAEVDESGYFVLITWKKFEKEDDNG